MNPFKAMLAELEHICEAARKLVELQEHSYLELMRINGRLDRMELWLARNADYPTSQTLMPDLAQLRANGVPE